ncbi:hypothetical protein MJO28_015595 [Puccinia striiformis f. sp. tritici]|uniref:Secreted protein n=4 Tax=Puccinia striiformis TaxID=27350 RepID=A0A0L0VP51_9BASI|nr:hypothetical protein Pst134EB_030059 [Puccinia striiformis f. sp. tritici]KAI9624224.1 hypothetical protein KEM48_009122 [Puccinia striiformis f. sp. tritici PST-130]KNF00967.1 hypothetical protein PSTG_05861 [Puccinia striiformis f. sp. tritici PST-78]POV95618.1 hypothetical protein PSTT_16135 [Puccinia striiformis]KAI7936484.1 hypothetical protein MJO29_015787 [Puccinia striiformis f. sp. tritici]
MNFLPATLIFTITMVMLNQAVGVFGANNISERPIKLARRTIKIGGLVGIENAHSTSIARRANGVRPDIGTEVGVSGGRPINQPCCQ